MRVGRSLLYLERHKFKVVLLAQIELSGFFQGIALAVLILVAILKSLNLFLAAELDMYLP